jgi:hypothetical protein
VRHSECHHFQLFVAAELKQLGEVEPNDSHQFVNAIVLSALHSETFCDQLSEFLISHGDLCCNLSVDNVSAQKLGQCFWYFATHQLGNAFEGIGSAVEFVEILQRNAM